MAEPVMLEPIVRTNYEEIEVTATNPNGTIRNITSDRLVFTAKLKLVDEIPVFQKTTDDVSQIEKTNAAGGVALIKIYAADTHTITRGLTLKCTLDVIDALGRMSTDFYDLPVQWR